MATEQIVRAGMDVGAAGAVVMALAGWLPPLAAALGIVWYVIQIAESETGKRFIAWVKSKVSRGT